MKLLWVLLAVLTPLLFIGGPDSESGRLNKEIWDFGHVPLFASLIMLVLSTNAVSRFRYSWPVLLVGTLVGTLLTGLSIEILQFYVGRSLEIKDVLSDLLGGGIGFLGHTLLNLRLTLWQRLITYLSVAVLIILALLPISVVLIDMYFIKQKYPVLADFETPFEVDRWNSHLAELERSEQNVRYGNYSMKVKFYPGDFSDITLHELAKDWRDYKYLRFSVFNGLDHDLPIVLKVYDVWHRKNGSDYSDRFNREITIKPFWNDIVVPLDDVLKAPEKREMDLSQINNLSLFMSHLDKNVEIYVDDFNLSK